MYVTNGQGFCGSHVEFFYSLKVVDLVHRVNKNIGPTVSHMGACKLHYSCLNRNAAALSREGHVSAVSRLEVGKCLGGKCRALDLSGQPLVTAARIAWHPNGARNTC